MRTLAICIFAAMTLAGATVLGLRPSGSVILAQYATTLQGRTDAQRHNAELAVGKLRGAIVKPGQVFSFVGRVGTWSRDAGYRRAPVSYNGTLIDAWGGGVCQTSTTLYNSALLAGMQIVERNHHRFAPSYAPPGRDAAVAFSSVDLRFRNPYDFPVKVDGRIEDNQLIVSITGANALKQKPKIVTDVRQVDIPNEYTIDRGGKSSHTRNYGKAGFDVVTYRVTGSHRELISSDSYPAMDRIVELR